ncbi:hypothetical protein SBADM41S_05461 [Streptomyces badius]
MARGSCRGARLAGRGRGAGAGGAPVALGGGLAVWAAGHVRRDLSPDARSLVGASGSFAAVSALLGSPLLGAFLLMEVSGLAGPMLGVVLVPGLLSAGSGR